MATTTVKVTGPILHDGQRIPTGQQVQVDEKIAELWIKAGSAHVVGENTPTQEEIEETLSSTETNNGEQNR